MTRSRRVASLGAAAAGLLALATWNVRQPSTPSSGPAPDGSTLFQAKGCAACHDGPGSTAELGDSVPSLADASSWAADRRPSLDAREYLTESILAPEAFVSPAFDGGTGPMTHMPRLQLDVAEVDALVEYLLAGGGEADGPDSGRSGPD